MGKSRREFLTEASVGLLGAAAVSLQAQKQKPATQAPAAAAAAEQPGTPSAFGTAPAVGPEVSPGTFAEAEKLVRVELTAAERAQAAGNWRNSMAALYERRTGPRKVALEATLSPASRWDPMLPGMKARPERDLFIRSKNEAGPLPARDEDIAFASVTQLSRWVEARQLSSERLTHIYLERIERFNPQLRCVITVTRELALQQAKQADAEIAAGKYRGPLHGIPVGRQRLAGHGRNCDDLWRRTFSQPRAGEKFGGGAASARCRRGVGCEAEPGRAGAQRHLVRRTDDEPVAAGRRRVGVQRRAGRGDRRGTGGFFGGKRDGREHRQPQHALRGDRTAAHVRASGAHGGDDAVLVAGQARAHDAQRGRRDAGAAGDHRSRCRGFGQRSKQAGFRCGCERARAARGIFSCVDERQGRDGGGSRGAGDREEGGHDSGGGGYTRTGHTTRWS